MNTNTNAVNLNNFFKEILIQKQFIKQLNKNIFLLENIKNFYNYIDFYKNKIDYTPNDNTVVYVIDITFSKTNTLLNVMTFSGSLVYSCSACCVNARGKAKKLRWLILKEFYKILLNKLDFLKKKPIALHLKNVGLTKKFILKTLKKKLFIKIIKVFELQPFNGCRKKKIKRKKFRTKKKKKKKWLSGL